MAKWRIYALYPSLGIKRRITEHDSATEVADYKNGLYACNTPFFVMKGAKLTEVHYGDMTKKEMADYVEKYC